MSMPTRNTRSACAGGLPNGSPFVSEVTPTRAKLELAPITTVVTTAVMKKDLNVVLTTSPIVPLPPRNATEHHRPSHSRLAVVLESRQLYWDMPAMTAPAINAIN